MANWNNPQLTTTYTDFLTIIKDRDVDLALQFDGVGTNIPTNAIRWDSTANRWKKWNGSAWNELTSTYALTGLTTTGNATIAGDLTINGITTIASGTAITPSTADNSTKIATTAYVQAQNYMPKSGGIFTGVVSGVTVASGTANTSLATTSFVSTEINNRTLTLTGGGTVNGTVVFSGLTQGSASYPITTDAQLIYKGYVDNYVSSKPSCRCASTTNLVATASGTQYLRASANGAITVDGIALSANDYVLVAAQTTAANNGVYTVNDVGSAGTPWVLQRANQADTFAKNAGSIVTVREGTSNADKIFLCTSNTGTLGSTALDWRPIHDAYIANLIDNSTNGLVVKNGTTSASRTLQVTGSGLTITNGDGTAGNPSFTLASASDNTASTVVFRDSTGAFSAGTISLKTQGQVRFEASGSTNYMALRAPSTVSTSTILTLPNGAGSSGNVLSTDGTGVLSWAVARRSSVEQITTFNSTVHEFTVPSWATNISIDLFDLSTNGTAVPLIQIGTSIDYYTSDYKGSVSSIAGATASSAALSSGFSLAPAWAAANVISGRIVIAKYDTSIPLYNAVGTFGRHTTAAAYSVAGHVSTGLATRIRLYINGTQLFDGGFGQAVYES